MALKKKPAATHDKFNLVLLNTEPGILWFLMIT